MAMKKAGGIAPSVTNHTLRATGISAGVSGGSFARADMLVFLGFGSSFFT